MCRPCDERKCFNRIVKLVRSGHTQHEIAKLCGLHRSVVQLRVELSVLPNYVINAYMPLLRGKHKETNFRWADVPNLYSAYKRNKLRKAFDAIEGRKGKRNWHRVSDCNRPKDCSGRSGDDTLNKIVDYLGPAKFADLVRKACC